jgi:hypothetical protein
VAARAGRLRHAPGVPRPVPRRPRAPTRACRCSRRTTCHRRRGPSTRSRGWNLPGEFISILSCMGN